MLEVDGLVSGYGGGVVLDGVSLRVAAGEVLGLLGRNGAGKSTLLRTLMGLLEADGGSVRFDGAGIANRPPFEIARRGIAYVPQGRDIFPDFTVLDNLRMGDLDRPAYDRAFRHFPVLKERQRDRAGALSGGQQQQLAIGRALMGAPRLMLLDEPSEGLQPSIVVDIADTLGRIVAETGAAVLLVEQNVDMVMDLCHRCAFMEKGRIAEQQDIEALRGRPEILDTYLAF